MNNNKIKKIFYTRGFTLSSIFLKFQTVMAADYANTGVGNPWDALHAGYSFRTDSILVQVYKFLEIIGLLGCTLTAVFYVVQIILHPSGARGVSAGKEGFKYKLIIAFFICTAALFMGIFFDLVYRLGGYN